MIRPVRKCLKKVIKGLSLSPIGVKMASSFAGKVTCLNYHRISAVEYDSVCSLNASLNVTAENFAQQMRLLADNYKCLSLPQALMHLESECDDRGVVVTFDDGFLDNLEYGLPILEHYNVPATIFICTDLIENRANIWWLELEEIVAQSDNLHFQHGARDWRLPCQTRSQKVETCQILNGYFKSLTVDGQQELIELLKSDTEIKHDFSREILSWKDVERLDLHPLINIGSHSVSHSVLRNCDENQLQQELVLSKSILEEKLGHSVDDFAYPFGLNSHASLREFAAVEQAGYRCAVTMRPGYWQKEHLNNRWCLPRIFVDQKDDLNAFKVKVEGSLAPLMQRFRKVVTD